MPLSKNVIYSNLDSQAAITVTQIEVEFSCKNNLWPIDMSVSRVASPYCSCSRRWFFMSGILYKEIPCTQTTMQQARRIVGVDNDTPVAMLQRSVNCPDQAVWFAIRMNCLSSCVNVTVRNPCRISDSSSFSCQLLKHSHHCLGIPLYTICCCAIRKKTFT